MGFQSLNGILVTPKGSYNLSRFGDSFNGSTWANSYAFGGWIYSASTDIGFSNAPNEIKLSIVLEASDRKEIRTIFDIKQADLRCDAGNGGDENLFDINFNGVNFTNYILYSYDISIESNTKILNVSFRDYSTILDKIYIGLLKRQGDKFVHTASSQVSFPVNCPDCMMDGNSFIQNGLTVRDINYGCYVGINGQIYDNFAGLPVTGNVFRRWEYFYNLGVTSPQFDLNGGYMILGTEDVTEEQCGDLGTISYTFNQLLAALRLRGLQFEGAFPRTSTESVFAYKQNYIGTLREVLQQWCSDLGFDFYCDGKKFVGINLTRALDIQKIVDIADPTTELGQNFALNTNTAILSYKENNTINNTYRQTVITANNRARQSKVHSKSPKRYVGYLPLHPIDFNSPNRERILRYDLFGNSYIDYAWINSFNPGSNDLAKTLSQLDNRTFDDIDTSIALSHYDSDLRDIYCQDGALYGISPEIRASNFRSLGMVPLIEIESPYDKSTAIQSVYSNQGDEVSNICLDQQYYRVFIGYYYSQYKQDITSWEQSAAESMYKYGAVVKGVLQGLPYIPQNVTEDLSPTAGLYGTYGTSTTKITQNFEPSTQEYYDLYTAPFKDIVLYSGLRNNVALLPKAMWIGELSNDWGTTTEQFKRYLSLRIDDACQDQFANSNSYTSIVNGVEKKFQDWKLSLFKPQIISDISSFFTQYLPLLQKLGDLTEMDRTVQTYYDFNFHRSNTCSKLHIMVMTDTRTHPNISVGFTKRGREFVNPVVLQKYQQKHQEAIKRRLATKTPSICDRSLLQDMCDGLIIQSGQAFKADPRFGCATEQQALTYEEGFDLSYMSSPNSRGLDIRLIKNPIRNNDTDNIQKIARSSDSAGAIYFTDLVSQELSYQQKQANLTIIYPISVNAADNIYYKGILTSEIEVENRTPETVEIFGEPFNSSNNRTAGVRVINNNVDPNLQPQLDPFSARFVSYITVITGDNQVITTVSGYHNFIKKLNDYQVTGVSKSVELSLAGTPDFFGTFINYISPVYGLNKFSINLGDGGVITQLSYSDVPKVLPKQEALLNKISPRLVK